MPFDITQGAEHVPIKQVRRWRLREQLASNAEYLLALPIGPLLQLQIAMATTGVRHVWDHAACQAVPLIDEATGRNVVLPDDAHLRLLESMITRLLPRTKSIDTESLRPKDADGGSLKNLPIAEIRAKLAALEEKQNAESAEANGGGAATKGTGDPGDAPVRPVDQ